MAYDVDLLLLHFTALLLIITIEFYQHKHNRVQTD